MTTKRIAITAGEPAGIGPDLVIQLAQQAWRAELVVCADPDLLVSRAKNLGLPLQLRPYQPNQAPKAQEVGTLTIVPFSLAVASECGKLDDQNSAYVIDTLRYAGEKNMNGEFDAVVTMGCGDSCPHLSHTRGPISPRMTPLPAACPSSRCGPPFSPIGYRA